mmetsp:Transcript_24840/g.40206  ORF Transcript_24840/g.40206 Transcript_24840/m.40206 type:complete len:207 (-) Transcript_24840:176-796(-)
MARECRQSENRFWIETFRQRRPEILVHMAQFEQMFNNYHPNQRKKAKVAPLPHKAGDKHHAQYIAKHPHWRDLVLTQNVAGTYEKYRMQIAIDLSNQSTECKIRKRQPKRRRSVNSAHNGDEHLQSVSCTETSQQDIVDDGEQAGLSSVSSTKSENATVLENKYQAWAELKKTTRSRRMANWILKQKKALAKKTCQPSSDLSSEDE